MYPVTDRDKLEFPLAHLQAKILNVGLGVTET